MSHKTYRYNLQALVHRRQNGEINAKDLGRYDIFYEFNTFGREGLKERFYTVQENS